MPQDLIPRDHAAVKAAIARRHAGQAPTIAPRSIVQSPIWYDPRVAVKSDALRWDWQTGEGGLFGRRRIITVNDVVVTGSGSVKSRGLLRWLDLDILIALSYEMFRLGSRDITVENKLLLTWMGYQSLENPPYEDLRASINRLANTTVQVLRPTLEQADPHERIMNTKLLGEGRVETKRGGGGGIHVVASEQWMAALVGDGQAIDVRAYLHLVRRIRGVTEDDGDGQVPNVARSILLFLDSWRQVRGNGSVVSEVKIDWLRDRFAERLTGPTAPHGKPPDGVSPRDWYWNDREKAGSFRHKDPWAPQGRLYQAVKALVAANIIEADVVTGNDRLTVRWTDPKKLDVIPGPERDRQQRLFAISKLTGEVLPGDAIERLEAAPSADSEERSTAETPTQTLQPALAADVALLSRLVPISKKTLAKAPAQGWTDRHLRHLYIETLWKRHIDEIRDPGAFAASEILNKPPQAYERESMRLRLDIEAVMAWWTGPHSPKHRLSQTDPPAQPPVSADQTTGMATDLLSYLASTAIPTLKRRLREVRRILDPTNTATTDGELRQDLEEERQDLEEALTTFAKVVSEQDGPAAVRSLQLAAVSLYASHQDLVKGIGGKILEMMNPNSASA